MKKGYTLIELMVSMGIFSVIAMIAVGAFSLVLKTRALSGNIRDLNQRIRYSTEIMSRYGRQANRVDLSDCTGFECKTATMYFYLDQPNSFAQRFEMTSGSLNSYECVLDANKSCPSWVNGINMLNNVLTLNTGAGQSYFRKTGTIIPTLEVKLAGVISNSIASNFLNNNFSMSNTILLESLK